MFVAIGKVAVPVAGTPVSILSRLSTAHLRKINATTQLAPAFGIALQTWYLNSGKIWIGDSDLSKSTQDGLAHVLLAPSATFAGSWSMALPVAQNALSLAGVYLDADNAGEFALLSLLVS